VLYMDEGIIYEEGSPEQIFEDPRKERTKAFINRTRSYTCQVTSPDYDLYAINAEIEAFCEKQILPREIRNNLLLAVEELLQIYGPRLGQATLEITISYSEKQDRLEVVFESTGEPGNPLETTQLADDLGLRLIRGVTQDLNYRHEGGRNRLELRMKS